MSRIEQANCQFVVDVENAGGQTAEHVTIAGDVQIESATVERATTAVPYVPPRSTQRAALIFDRDPRDGVLSVRASRFTLP